MYFKNRMCNGGSRSSKVIDFGNNQKRVCNFLLVINSNLGPTLSPFRDIAGFLFETAIPPLIVFAEQPSQQTVLNTYARPYDSNDEPLRFAADVFSSCFQRVILDFPRPTAAKLCRMLLSVI